MAKLRMNVAGTERVAELIEEVAQKAEELQKLTEQLMSAVYGLNLSGTLELDKEAEANGGNGLS